MQHVRSAIVIIGGSLVAAAVFGSAWAEASFERGQEKAATCVACHGVDGLSPNPMFPNLAGQNAAYLEIQLMNFKTGERYHPLMSPIAESLSNEDIESLAIYYNRITITGNRR